ncbi:MAG: 50S ribosomal protein L11 methyltransferase [Cyanobacteria bacterium RUI128]|nr:50S ribosomal protein L11 methyltransferase [Cyanobacteria bacterium RUI128]
MNNYYELYIKINPAIEDDVANICFENLDCEGVLLEEQKFKDLEMTETSRGTLKVFLRSLETPTGIDVCEFIKSKREELLRNGFTEDELGSWDCALLEKENEDWSKKWKENWEVTHISDKVVIVPSWLEYSPKETEITVSLDPGCAFGTGTHQTTQLCVVGMEQYPELIKGKKVADIGMGSGILSIIAKKFGAEYVYGCDNDPTVIDVAKENAQKNGVKCEFELGTADMVNDKFDFICANILHNVLYEIMPDLKRLVKDDGVISLSGIMDNKKDIVLEAIKNNGLKILKTNNMEPWVSYVVSK